MFFFILLGSFVFFLRKMKMILFLLGFCGGQLQKDFSSDLESVSEVLRSLTAEASYDRADLTPLFRLATQQAKKSRSQSRILRVVSLYACFSCHASFHFLSSWIFFIVLLDYASNYYYYHFCILQLLLCLLSSKLCFHI